MPALVFFLKEEDLEWTDFDNQDLWIEDPSTCHSSRYPHEYLRYRLKNFVETNGREVACDSPVYVLQDISDWLYLWLDAVPTRTFKTDLKDEFSRSSWIHLFDRYGLKMIIGNFSYQPLSTSLEITRHRSGVVLSDEQVKDLIGKERTNNFIYSFAQRYQMSNYQYLRFRLLALGLEEARLNSAKLNNVEIYEQLAFSLPYDQLAQEIIEADSKT